VRFPLRCLLAAFLVLAAQSRALAYVHVDVDLSSQTMSVHSDRGADFVWPISSGRQGYATPRGVFHPRALYTMVHSAKYGNAPMPHSIFFHGQYAIHGTGAVGSLGRPASHGCIRLSPGNAATLFAMVQAQGAQIRIVGSVETRIAHVRHHHHRHGPELALAYAPAPRAAPLEEWVRHFFGR